MASLAQSPTQVWRETEYGYDVSTQMLVDYDGFEDTIEVLLHDGYEPWQFLSDEIS